MSEDYEWIDDTNLHELVNRFEKMINAEMQFFFDVNEFEAVIDYYIDFQDFDKSKIAVESALLQHPSCSSFNIRSAKLLAQSGSYYEALEELNQIELILR